MQTSVQKWGNSLGVRIPMHLAQKLHLHAGSPVNIDIENGRLILEPPQYNLESMLSEITPQNKHTLMLNDRQKGAEEW